MLAIGLSTQFIASPRYPVPDHAKLENRARQWFRAMAEEDAATSYGLTTPDSRRCHSLDEHRTMMFGGSKKDKIHSWSLKDIKGAKRGSVADLESGCDIEKLKFDAAAIVTSRLVVQLEEVNRPTTVTWVDIWLYIDGQWYWRGGGSKWEAGHL
jgi:hypothetical protein